MELNGSIPPTFTSCNVSPKSYVAQASRLLAILYSWFSAWAPNTAHQWGMSPGNHTLRSRIVIFLFVWDNLTTSWKHLRGAIHIYSIIGFIKWSKSISLSIKFRWLTSPSWCFDHRSSCIKYQAECFEELGTKARTNHPTAILVRP